MSTEEKMTIDEPYKYFRMMKRRYERANKQEKGKSLEHQPRAKQRGSNYDPAIDDAPRVIAESLDYYGTIPFVGVLVITISK